MEQNLLNKGELAQTQTVVEQTNQRKKKKRKILKQEELISEQVKEYEEANENILKEELPSFENPLDEASYLRNLTAKLRAKCRAYITDAKDLQKEFEVERESWTDTLRDSESELSFFKAVTKNLLSDAEILKIRDTSAYDPEKREYTVAPFILKDSTVHFPKTLTNEQLQDLIAEKRAARNLEFVKLEPIKTKEEDLSSSSPNFRSKKYVYKVPDY